MHHLISSHNQKSRTRNWLIISPLPIIHLDRSSHENEQVPSFVPILLGVPSPRRRRLVSRHRHVLRRSRRLWHHGRRVRVRQPVQRRVRREQCGAELDAVQRRRVVRAVLPHHLRRVASGRAVVQAGQLHHGVRHQPVPGKLRAPQRRVVRPGAPPLRHVAAGVGAHRHLQSRRHPGPVPAGQVLAHRRRALRHRRLPVFPARQHPEPRRQWLRGRRLGEGRQDGVDPDVQELGRQLAGARRARRPGAQLRRYHYRRAVHSVLERGAWVVAVRTDLHHNTEFLLLKPASSRVWLDLPVAISCGSVKS